MVWPFDDSHHLHHDHEPDPYAHQPTGLEAEFGHPGSAPFEPLGSDWHHAPFGHDAGLLHTPFDPHTHAGLGDAAQDLLHQVLGLDDDSGIMDIDGGGGGGHVRRPPSETWAADTASYLSDHGLDAIARPEATSGDLLADLIQGRQVVLGQADPFAEQSGALGGMMEHHGGRVIRAVEFDLSDPEHPQILIVDHSTPHAPPTPYPLNDFVHPAHDAHAPYVTTGQPAPHALQADGFDASSGYFTQAVDWVKDNAPHLAAVLVGAGVGELVSDMAGSDMAGVAAFVGAEHLVGHVMGANIDPPGLFEAAKFGIAAYNDFELDKFLDDL